MSDKIIKTKEEWLQQLTPEQYAICREKGTERPFTGKYNNTDTAGTYVCACCGEELFTSDAKFNSSCGWPSFTKTAPGDTVEEHEDHTLGMWRTEVTCKRCDSHLGHVFNDGPPPTGLRYCINSASIKLVEKS
ncbi:MAG: peptide-methionine (R)-S-oxide reductase MsrB [Rhodospirillaceae bacterium]|nr:peptide-methionine (R)-S-oxide reductase MsrB [Rhodospirillaceae bacterium]